MGQIAPDLGNNRERTDATLLELDDVSLALGGRTILDRVSLSVRAGEIVTLIGPNGSGKTTLARVALNLMRPDAGNVQCRPKLRIGYVPQHIHIDEILPLSTRRFVSLSRAAPDREIRKVFEEAGISDLMNVPVQSLSGGEMQRLLLARALLADPDLMVLDEPAQGVDVRGQAELYNLVRRIRDDRGCGVLLISHDLHLVMAASDHVVCLNHHVCCSGVPEEVGRDPVYLELFGAREREALAVYRHNHDHSHDVAGEIVDPDGDR